MVLTLYFALSTLIAPWLCCCTFAATPTSTIEAEVAECCCCQQHLATDPAPQDLPNKHECPCRGERLVPAVITKADTVRTNFDTSLDAIISIDEMPSQLVLAYIADTSADPTPLAIQDRLSLYCRLLC